MAHPSNFWFNNSELRSENYTSRMFSDDAGATDIEPHLTESLF